MGSGEERSTQGKGIESGERHGAAAGKGKEYAIRRGKWRARTEICDMASDAVWRRAREKNIESGEQRSTQGKGMESGERRGTAAGKGNKYPIRRAKWRLRERKRIRRAAKRRGGHGKEICNLASKVAGKRKKYAIRGAAWREGERNRIRRAARRRGGEGKEICNPASNTACRVAVCHLLTALPVSTPYRPVLFARRAVHLLSFGSRCGVQPALSHCANDGIFD